MGNNIKKERVPLTRLQQRLAIVWAVAFVLAVILMFLFGERLGEARAKGWGWFSQVFAPTAGVVVTGLIAAQRSKQSRWVSLFFYRFTWLALVFYAVVALTTPVTAPKDVLLVDWLHESATWLGIIQGLIVSLVTFAFSERQVPEK